MHEVCWKIEGISRCLVRFNFNGKQGYSAFLARHLWDWYKRLGFWKNNVIITTLIGNIRSWLKCLAGLSRNLALLSGSGFPGGAGRNFHVIGLNMVHCSIMSEVSKLCLELFYVGAHLSCKFSD